MKLSDKAFGVLFIACCSLATAALIYVQCFMDDPNPPSKDRIPRKWSADEIRQLIKDEDAVRNHKEIF